MLIFAQKIIFMLAFPDEPGCIGAEPSASPAFLSIAAVRKISSPILEIVTKASELIEDGKMSWLRVMSVLLIFWGVTASNAFAQTTQLIEGVPKTWRLQNYVGGTVVVYFTGSPCQSGLISMPASATPDENSRVYSLIMSAKISGQAVGVYYTYDGTSCVVTSFYLIES